MLVQRDIEVSSPPLAVSPKSSPTLERRRRWERQFRWCLRVSDHAIIVFAVGGAALLQATIATVSPRSALAAGMLVLLWSFFLAGMRSRENQCLGSGAVEYQRVAHATGLALGAVAVWALLVGWAGDRVLLFAALPIGLAGLLISRWGWRRWLRRQRSDGEYCSRVLVVGSQRDVAYVVTSLGAEDSGFHIVGAILIDTDKKSAATPHGWLPFHDSIERVREAAAALEADTIVIATKPENDPDFIRELSWQLEGTAANLLLSNQVTDVVGPRISFRPVDGLPMVQIKIPSYEGGHYFLKRGLDITVATCALIVIGLATPFIALAIKLDSRGPVFFSQPRVGKDGERFRIFKFRSMTQDAEQRLGGLQTRNEGSGSLFKMRNDPRVTNVGRWLRRLSVDELPQFWNVLRGDMSVVGPRPPLPTEVTSYDGQVVRRLYVKPGITGPWQVGGRSDLSWEESVRLDLSYVENWSVMNDLQLIWRTARVVTHGAGAY
ncbi:sugar transferase [Leucobacter salsicius]|uniref:sugar transferase n=1 Tax=Leucobacter salsicius TaxID=664638 RepID=UPI000348B688|nr:sugar transferase [Leucobacter salsicius]